MALHSPLVKDFSLLSLDLHCPLKGMLGLSTAMCRRRRAREGPWDATGVPPPPRGQVSTSAAVPWRPVRSSHGSWSTLEPVLPSTGSSATSSPWRPSPSLSTGAQAEWPCEPSLTCGSSGSSPATLLFLSISGGTPAEGPWETELQRQGLQWAEEEPPSPRGAKRGTWRTVQSPELFRRRFASPLALPFVPLLSSPFRGPLVSPLSSFSSLPSP